MDKDSMDHEAIYALALKFRDEAFKLDSIAQKLFGVANNLRDMKSEASRREEIAKWREEARALLS